MRLLGVTLKLSDDEEVSLLLVVIGGDEGG